MLIKVTIGSAIEFYTITSIKDVMESDVEYKQIECFGLAYELTYKLIRNYSVVSKNATYLLNDMLAQTTWSVGTIDVDFDSKFRALDISSSSVLDSIISIAQTFNALIVWDTINRKINFKVFDLYGSNFGLKIKYSKLMQSVSMESDSTEFCTRLKVFGRDDLSINSVNPTGTNFIQSFGYFKYPFYTQNGVVMKSSYYFSDALCLAIEAYETLINNNKTSYQTLLTTRTTLQNDLISLSAQLTDLNSQLEVIEDNLSIANSAQQDVSSLISQKTAKITQITSKQTEINNKNTQLTSNTTSINNLKTLLAMEKNFTQVQLTELNPFIIEKEWSDNNFTDAQELYDAALLEFDKIREPSIKVDISVVNFLEIMSEQRNWDKLNLGDTITIEHDRIGINVQAKITEITYDYGSGDINLTIANVKDILSDEEKFIKNLSKSISTSTSVDMSKYGWDDAKSKSDEVTLLLNGIWDANDRKIAASVNEQITIDRQGLRARSVDDPNEMLILQHGTLALTSDGGNHWRTAITPEGVFAERLIGQIVAGNNLTITNDSGSFLANSSGLTVTDLDLTLTRSDHKSRILMDATYGFKIQKSSNNGASWSDSFNADSNGNLVINNLTANNGTFNGTINAAGGTFSGNITASGTISGGSFSGPTLNNGSIVGGTLSIGSGNSIFKADGNGIYLGNSSFGSAPFRVNMAGNATLTGANISGNISMTSGSIQWSSVNSDPLVSSASSAAGSALSISQQIANGTYTGGTFINQNTIFSANIFGGQITSNTTINVGTDITVGRNLKLTGGGLNSITMSGTGSIDFDSNTGIMSLGAYNSINLNANTLMNGDFLATQGWVIAYISSRLASKADVGHTHSGSVTTANHNHGNPQNVTSGGGTYNFTVY